MNSLMSSEEDRRFMKTIKFIFVILMVAISAACFWLLPANADSTIRKESPSEMANDSKTSSASKLSVLLRSDQNQVNLGAPLLLEIHVVNSGSEPVALYSDLRWGYSASLSLQVMDSRNQPVEPEFVDDALTKPILAESLPISLIYPGHFLGVLSARRLEDAGITKQGKYKLQVQYHSPLSAQRVSEKAFWSREDGPVLSNTLIVEVIR